jgi:2-polyprenyl-3-methyl-5-hydroxy-6-metoxy-1,4-benzoquinol methylase
MPHDEALSRSFYAALGAEGLRRRTRPQWDAVITQASAAYLGKRERVLDAGCGYGRIAIPLAARGYRVSGLDLSAPLLISARETA